MSVAIGRHDILAVSFHTHPEIETDMRLFTLGPEGDRIAADPAFWTDYLGTDFADSWED